MKRPLSFIVLTAAAAVLVAGIGASAHSGGPFFSRLTGVHNSQLGDKASGFRTESPEPTDSPEASPAAEPTEPPDASPSPEPTETPEADSETTDTDKDVEAGATTQPPGDEHDGGSGGGD